MFPPTVFVTHVSQLTQVFDDFVDRHGWEGDAIVQVTLLNNSQGYKFDEYGDSITVKRTIKQPSGGGFALISHDGQVSESVWGFKHCAHDRHITF